MTMRYGGAKHRPKRQVFLACLGGRMVLTGAGSGGYFFVQGGCVRPISTICQLNAGAPR